MLFYFFTFFFICATETLMTTANALTFSSHIGRRQIFFCDEEERLFLWIHHSRKADWEISSSRALKSLERDKNRVNYIERIIIRRETIEKKEDGGAYKMGKLILILSSYCMLSNKVVKNCPRVDASGFYLLILGSFFFYLNRNFFFFFHLDRMWHSINF